MFRRTQALISSCIATCILLTPSTHARTIEESVIQQRSVDLVIALDVSGSMSGLIDSAKQRLWDIVNEVSQAQPQPDLRMAILTYGNPSYGEQSGYVNIDLPFTRDLDAVMQTLFNFTTNGGDEYVARAVQTSVDDLAWTPDSSALKILFVAGNEEADQDPDVSIHRATQSAANKGIVINTIYCGSENDSIVAEWREFATLTNGLFASIDQNAAAVANVPTPMDAEIAELNRELNETYVAYGDRGRAFKQNQVDQDKNAAEMSMPSVASRTVAKVSGLYRNESWDLVDAVGSGVAVEEMEPESLPEKMQALDMNERKEFVQDLSDKRDSISAKIADLGKKREAYVAIERAKYQEGSNGLDEAILKGIRELARKKGFEFSESR